MKSFLKSMIKIILFYKISNNTRGSINSILIKHAVTTAEMRPEQPT